MIEVSNIACSDSYAMKTNKQQLQTCCNGSNNRGGSNQAPVSIIRAKDKGLSRFIYPFALNIR